MARGRGKRADTIESDLANDFVRTSYSKLQISTEYREHVALLVGWLVVERMKTYGFKRRFFLVKCARNFKIKFLYISDISKVRTNARHHV